ncbi:MAG: helix-turn-helix domain-containing protein [Luteitalea sp.]|nr:helix-turn-helix domain-containing protein [Luteitalea sp.]
MSPEPPLPAGTFFGRRLRAIEADGVRLSECTYNAGQRLPPHAHEQALFTYLVDGCYEEIFGRLRALRTQHTLVFLPAGLLHTEEHRTRGHRLIVELSRSLTESLPQRLAVDHAGHLRDPRAQTVASRLCRELDDPDNATPLVIEGLALWLLHDLLHERLRPADRRTPAFLGIACEHIEASLHRALTTTEIALVAGVDRWQLARAFRAHFACTPGDYVRRRRVEVTRVALADPNRSLADIAAQAGFFDQSHFCRIFRRFTGLTPLTYRRHVVGSQRAAHDGSPASSPS